MSDDTKKTPDKRPKGGTGKKPAKAPKPRTSNHHPDEEPAFNTVLESEERKKTATAQKSAKRTTGISRSSALVMSGVAALVGGAIGWGGPLLFGGQSAKNAAVQTALEQTRSDLATAQAEQKKLTDTLASIQGTSRNQASSNQSIVTTLNALEDQIQKLQDAQPADNSEALAALDERISKIGTLTLSTEEGETSDVDVLGLVERLNTLEAGGSTEIIARIEALETQAGETNVKPAAFPEPDTTPIEIPVVETEQSAQEALNVLIETFPRTKMLETVAAQKAQAAKKPSWLQRTLSRHVKTHDEQVTDPVETIDAAEAALKSGDVTATLNLMSELNPPVRAIAADWMGAAKKAAKRIEKDL